MAFGLRRDMRTRRKQRRCVADGHRMLGEWKRETKQTRKQLKFYHLYVWFWENSNFSTVSLEGWLIGNCRDIGEAFAAKTPETYWLLMLLSSWITWMHQQSVRLAQFSDDFHHQVSQRRRRRTRCHAFFSSRLIDGIKRPPPCSWCFFCLRSMTWQSNLAMRVITLVNQSVCLAYKYLLTSWGCFEFKREQKFRWRVCSNKQTATAIANPTLKHSSQHRADRSIETCKWQVASAKWQVTSGKWQIASDKWQVTSGTGRWTCARCASLLPPHFLAFRC